MLVTFDPSHHNTARMVTPEASRVTRYRVQLLKNKLMWTGGNARERTKKLPEVLRGGGGSTVVHLCVFDHSEMSIMWIRTCTQRR